MRVFARVVEAGNFTKAADSLQMPKPTVTKLVQSLEAHLKVKLLQRTTRSVTVTSDGAVYYERVVRLLADLDEIEATMSRARTSPKGRLRIDVGTSVAHEILIPHMMDFHARYPDLQVEMGVTDRPVNLVSDNVDCVIRGGTLTDQSLVARRIATVDFMTCATPEYVRRHGLPSHPSEIETAHQVVNYVSAANGRLFPLTFEKDGETLEIEGRHVLAVNEASAYMVAGMSGLGIFQPVRFMAESRIASGELVQVLPEWGAGTLPIYVVYPSNRHLSAKVRAFVDWVVELFAQHQAFRPRD